MSESSQNTNRTILLVVNLLLMAACLAGLVLLIVLYPFLRNTFIQKNASPTNTLRPSQTWTLIPTLTPTPTITRTPRPLATATTTLTPTVTVTPTQTPTGTNLPTLTPAKPAVLSDAYRLAPWSPAAADYMVRLMQGFPATIGSDTSSSSNNLAYFQAFKLPVFALTESLFRFPGAAQADAWKWMLAFDLALTGDVQAGEQYATLISEALNRDQTDLSQLYAWFQLREPRMQLYLVEAAAPPGFTASYLIELRCSGGSALLRLLEKNRVFRADALLTSFDFVNPREINWILADLNGDPQDGEEIAVFHSSAAGETYLDPPRVFNLSHETPLELPFLPAEKIFTVGMDFTNYWGVQPLPAGGNDLAFESVIFPACPLKLRRVYHWNKLYFTLASEAYLLEALPQDLSPCETLIDHAAYFWGPAVTAQLMDGLTAQWPPRLDVEGKPYPADAKDEWLYRLGVYRALSGESQAATALFNQVSTQPTVLASRWITPAQEFLGVLQKPEAIYTACQLAHDCYPAQAIEYLVKRLPEQKTPALDALDILKKWDVTVTSSGFFDFDRDNEAERWFTIRYFPRERLSFWILAKKATGYRALEIPNMDSIHPTLDYIAEAYIADEALQYQPAVLLDGSVALSMQRLPDTQEPYLVQIPLRKEYPSRFFVPLENYKNSLLSGASPELIQRYLLDLAVFPGLLCKTTWSCDEYHYLLGLSSELAGDEQAAVQAYQRVWLDYSQSPYTTLARLKLQGRGTPVVSATPSPTPSMTLFAATAAASTSTPTYTPTGTRATPTTTGTRATSTITLTPTVSPSPTVTGTPPTATPTPSPTITETQGIAPPSPTPTQITYPGQSTPTETPKPTDTPPPRYPTPIS